MLDIIIFHWKYVSHIHGRNQTWQSANTVADTQSVTEGFDQYDQIQDACTIHSYVSVNTEGLMSYIHL